MMASDLVMPILGRIDRLTIERRLLKIARSVCQGGLEGGGGISPIILLKALLRYGVFRCFASDVGKGLGDAHRCAAPLAQQAVVFQYRVGQLMAECIGCNLGVEIACAVAQRDKLAIPKSVIDIAIASLDD